VSTRGEDRSAPGGLQVRAKALRGPGQFTILLIAILCFLLVPPFFIHYEPPS